MTNDLYARFLRPQAAQKELVLAARVASVVVTAIGAWAAFNSQDIATVYRLILAVGTGPGLVLILRWYWWRINAWAEMAAMLAGFITGFLTSVNNPIYNLRIDDFGIRLMVTAAISLAVWVPVMYLTAPESQEKLDAFYRRVRPAGPGWRRQRERTGLAPLQDLRRDLLCVVAGLMLLFGLLFGIGGVVLLRWPTAIAMLALALAGGIWLRALHRRGVSPAAGTG